MTRIKLRAAHLAVLAVALVSSLATRAHAGTGVDAAALLPADTDVVLSINVKRLRKSAAFDDILKLARERDDYKKGFGELKKAGINLERDIDTLMLGVRYGTAGADPDGVVLVAEGRFRAKRLVRLLRKKNADMKTEHHAGVTYYTLDSDGSLAILGRRVILAENNRIRDVINLFKGKGDSLGKNKHFKQMLSKTDTGRDLWFTAQMPKDKGGGFGVPMADQLESFTGSLDLRRGLGIRFRIATKSASTAKTLVSQFEMLKSMAVSEPQMKQLGLDAVIQKSTVVADESDVAFAVDLTAAEAKKLKGIVDMAKGAGGAM